MHLQDYIEEIKLELTGGILDLELTDEQLGKVVLKAFRELQRYIDETKLVTVPYSRCIDLTGFNSSAIVAVYRTEGYSGDSTDAAGMADPMYAQQWMIFSNGGTMYNLNDYVMNYLSYNTLLQMRNTTSTDLAFKEDKVGNKLYINTAYDKPVNITIEYIPVFKNVEEITSDYWIDILQRLSIALTKVTLGRIRTRYVQSNAQWSQDGETMLTEGNTELTELREMLRVNSMLTYGID